MSVQKVEVVEQTAGGNLTDPDHNMQSGIVPHPAMSNRPVGAAPAMPMLSQVAKAPNNYYYPRLLSVLASDSTLAYLRFP